MNSFKNKLISWVVLCIAVVCLAIAISSMYSIVSRSLFHPEPERYAGELVQFECKQRLPAAHVTIAADNGQKLRFSVYGRSCAFFDGVEQLLGQRVGIAADGHLFEEVTSGGEIVYRRDFEVSRTSSVLGSVLWLVLSGFFFLLWRHFQNELDL